MGVVSRRVVPACGNLCFFCPSLRARSRQPVKRYKKLLAEIFPKSQEAEPNDRKIGKLCEYASKNPLRIPRITTYLEQRCYKDLRNENFGSVKVVLCIYKKLLSSCKEQMPLFASSLLGIVRTLVEQNREDDIRLLGCDALVDLINGQVDSTYMFNLEGLIPKLCQLAQEVGDNDRALRLRSAALQALASMIWFMGEQSHISMDFDNIISVVLENFSDCQMNLENAKLDLKNPLVSVTKVDDQSSSSSETSMRVASLPNVLSGKHETDSSMDTSRSPSYWSRVCLNNMAGLARETTSVRRVLEPLFHNFDAENHWHPEKGIAFPVLTYMQLLLEKSGANSYLLLSTLVKHLDNKVVIKQQHMQVDILNVIAQLARSAKLQTSVAVVGAISDLMKHLRKCMQFSSEECSPRDDTNKCEPSLQPALEESILQLCNKVGDVGPILDTLAVVLENTSTATNVTRKTISAVHRIAEIISSIPNVSYHKKAFPDALFHQLLSLMAHPDHETRAGAHYVFSAVLIPSLSCPLIDKNENSSQDPAYISLASQKIRSISFSSQDENDKPMSNGFKHTITDGRVEVGSLRLSSQQVSLLLSSIWVQATSSENSPANFEAMAHTYNIALLFIQSKQTSRHAALIRCFQLALSLRCISLNQEGGLHPSRRRSLFTLASYMLIFSAKAGSISELIPLVKASLTDITADPYLELVDDVRLQAVSLAAACSEMIYGSQEDELAALRSLSEVGSDDQTLRETLITHFTNKLGELSEDELSDIKTQLSERFSPDDVYPLGVPLFMDTPRPCSHLSSTEFQAFHEVFPVADLTDDEVFPDPNGSQSDRKSSLSVNTVDILSVNQLLESVLETARQVASFPASSTPMTYDQMKNQCEALVSGKQQKMSVLQSFKHNKQEVKAIIDEEETRSLPLTNGNIEFSEEDLKLINDEAVQAQDQLVLSCSHEYGQQNSFRLPPSSPYDKFLKAAGC